jgi:predicted RNA-binding protein with PUA-like domain
MTSRARAYWLMKTEPDVFSIFDLERKGVEPWDGVRNYQARNHMRQMNIDDYVLFYHSNAEPSGVAGIAKIVKTAAPDPSQFDARSQYYDPKSRLDDPRWSLVEVGFVERFPHVVSLATLKADVRLSDMVVVQRGSRLSVQPVTKSQFKIVAALGGASTKIR